ncbi:Hypothetical protein PHPALM_14783 [Phytophthora palmivora]|uniref:Arginine N-methyltransferase n=1 Tax=Phytophthora palmivora TaxID=4796 RepID=A0A2P4XTT9_9STRA|nr:Hypothetical protein PHPALM_14783 [Phytophthora palmivora]
MPEDDIRVAISRSNLMLNDIPIATNNCMNELLDQTDEKTAYARRDMLRRTFSGIVDDLISSGTSSNGTLLTTKEYTFIIADKVMGLYAIWDMWAVGGIVSEYFQPICGPTELIGEIDDGTAEKALGMSIVQDAFNHSEGIWTKDGDGTVTITFKSVDIEDVAVNIKSGGDKIAEVSVPAGKTVEWKSNVVALAGKTLYLNRWRPGFLGLPGTGGGSLLLWVPRSTKGSLDLTAILNGNRKTLDELGQEVIWSSLGQQVMMQWEKKYMEQCVNALAILPTDRVLEIGFGLAYSASHIQTFQPKSHTIIECDQETLQRAQQFAARHRGVEIVAGTWQQQLPTLDQFDCIFFDDYPLPELELENPLARSRAFGRQRSRWHEFLDVALKHCATGARISGYLARKLDLKRPGCQISVSRVPVDVPEHCNYFPHKTALVPVIRVTDRDVAGGFNLEVEALLPLPHMSKKFLLVKYQLQACRESKNT